MLCHRCRHTITPLDRLSPREVEVLCGRICMLNNRQIGMQLNLSTSTVNAYGHNAMRKLGIKTLYELLTYK